MIPDDSWWLFSWWFLMLIGGNWDWIVCFPEDISIGWCQEDFPNFKSALSKKDFNGWHVSCKKEDTQDQWRFPKMLPQNGWFRTWNRWYWVPLIFFWNLQMVCSLMFHGIHERYILKELLGVSHYHVSQYPVRWDKIMMNEMGMPKDPA